MCVCVWCEACTHAEVFFFDKKNDDTQKTKQKKRRRAARSDPISVSVCFSVVSGCCFLQGYMTIQREEA